MQLLAACREAFSAREGVSLDSEDELRRRLTRVIQRNLHVVFAMNLASADFGSRCTTSPALFNRCVVAQVARAFTLQLNTGYTQYKAPMKRTQVLELELVLSHTGQDVATLSEDGVVRAEMDVFVLKRVANAQALLQSLVLSLETRPRWHEGEGGTRQG